MKMRSLTIKLEPSVIAQLKALAYSEERSQSQLVRRAIRKAYLEPPKPRQLRPE